MAAEASQANVVARMFENLSKCLTENAALLRELHARGQSGGAAGPSGGVPGPSASAEAPSPTKKRKADEAAKPKQVRTLSAYMLFMAAGRDAVSQSASQSVITTLLPTEHMVHYTHSDFSECVVESQSQGGFMAAERDAVKRTRSRARVRARARALGRTLAPARARAQP